MTQYPKQQISKSLPNLNISSATVFEDFSNSSIKKEKEKIFFNKWWKKEETQYLNGHNSEKNSIESLNVTLNQFEDKKNDPYLKKRNYYDFNSDLDNLSVGNFYSKKLKKCNLKLFYINKTIKITL